MAQGFNATAQFRGESQTSPVCDPHPPFSCQCEAAQREHVLRWRGQNLWMTVSWVPLEILWLMPPSPLASLLLQDTTHLMRIRCTHACRHLRLPVRACQTLRHPCSLPPSPDNAEIRLKTSQLRLHSRLVFCCRVMTRKLFCPPVLIFSGSEATVPTGGSQRRWWQMYSTAAE